MQIKNDSITKSNIFNSEKFKNFILIFLRFSLEKFECFDQFFLYYIENIVHHDLVIADFVSDPRVCEYSRIVCVCVGSGGCVWAGVNSRPQGRARSQTPFFLNNIITPTHQLARTYTHAHRSLLTLKLPSSRTSSDTTAPMAR